MNKVANMTEAQMEKRVRFNRIGILLNVWLLRFTLPLAFPALLPFLVLDYFLTRKFQLLAAFAAYYSKRKVTRLLESDEWHARHGYWWED